jgi:glycosyltransferase involved in cell wall biosynthesis
MFSRSRDRRLWRLKQNLAARRASSAFTISDASRATIAEMVDAPDMTVLHAAPDAAFRERGAAEIEMALEDIGLEAGDPFVLYAGGVGRHKGLSTLLDAWESIPVELPPLVLAGSFDDDGYAPVNDDLVKRASELYTVRFTGFVSDDVLACLYSSATMVVVPSLAEGFGLPAVEAAACGAAVVLSEIAPHVETLEDAALFFPPGDEDELAGLIRLLLEDEQLRARLGDEARQAAGRLSWDDSAARLRDLVHAAARR